MPLHLLAVNLIGTILWLHSIQHIFLPLQPLRSVAILLLPVYIALAAPMQFRAAAAAIAAACMAFTAVLLATGSPPEALGEGLGSALVFMGFLPAVGLIRALFAYSAGLAQLERMLDTQTPDLRANSLLILSHIAGAVMTLGVFALIGRVSGKTGDPQERMQEATACMRGLGLAVLWTPFTIGMGFASSRFPEVPLWQAMACGMVLSLAGLAFSLRQGGPGAVGEYFRAVRPTLVPVMIAALALMLANTLTGYGTVHIITVVTPLLVFGFVLIRDARAVPALGRSLFTENGRMGGEMLIFASSMVMGTALTANPAFMALLAQTGLQGAPGFMIAGVAVLMAVAFALAGLHVTVSATIVLAVISGLDGAPGPLTLIMLILFIWSSGTMLSQSSLALITCARVFTTPAVRLTYGRNLVFALGLGGVLAAAAGSMALVHG